MRDESRDDFERRLLALVRAFMDHEPDNHEIGEFAVVYEVLFRQDDDQPLDAWGRGTANKSGIAYSFSTRSEWVQEALMREALAIVEEKRAPYVDDADDDDEDEDPDDSD
jgi:hypothetical protein